MTDVATGGQQAAVKLSPAGEQTVRELTERARAGGLKLTGEGGLLGKLTKMVVEGALKGEMDDHLGYSRHAPERRGSGNSRNGHRPKTVLTEYYSCCFSVCDRTAAQRGAWLAGFGYTMSPPFVRRGSGGEGFEAGGVVVPAGAGLVAAPPC